MTTRVCAIARVQLNAIKKWRANKATHTSAFRMVVKHLETFIYEETPVFAHAWKIAGEKEAI